MEKQAEGNYPKAIIVHKEWGETPLQCLNFVRSQFQIPASVPMTYAGRLDPLATGALIILIDDECKNKNEYLDFTKEYHAQFAAGISTDTGDIFGLITKNEIGGVLVDKDFVFELDSIKKFSEQCLALKEQQYPLFSSKKVQGKQLFEYGIAGNDIERPLREVKIYTCSAQQSAPIFVESIFEKVKQASAMLGEGFRGKEIEDSWRNNIKSAPAATDQSILPTLELNCSVSSGTYIRGFAEVLQAAFEIPFVMTQLHRSHIGTFECPPLPHGTFVIR